jgi:hypothetical protein
MERGKESVTFDHPPLLLLPLQVMMMIRNSHMLKLSLFHNKTAVTKTSNSNALPPRYDYREKYRKRSEKECCLEKMSRLFKYLYTQLVTQYWKQTAWSHALVIHLCNALYARNYSIDTPSNLSLASMLPCHLPSSFHIHSQPPIQVRECLTLSNPPQNPASKLKKRGYTQTQACMPCHHKPGAYPGPSSSWKNKPRMK